MKEKPEIRSIYIPSKLLAVLTEYKAHSRKNKKRDAYMSKRGKERTKPEIVDNVSTSDFAERFSVSPRTVRNWIARGKLEAFQIPGGQYRIPVSEAERLKKGGTIPLTVGDKKSGGNVDE